MRRRQILNISIGTILLTILGLILIYYNILGKKYYDIIIKINIIIQSLCIAMFLISRFNKSKGVKMVRLRLNNILIKGDINIFPEPISSTSPRNPAIFKIYWEIGEFAKEDPPEFNIDIIGSNGKEMTEINSRILDIKTRIVKNIFLYNADIKIMPNEKINFKFRKDANVKIFNLEEVYIF